MKKLVVLLLIITTFMLPSCRTMMVYRMEVLRPGYMDIPKGYKKVMLVDNAGRQLPEIGHKYYEFGRFVKDTSFVTDSLSTMVMSFLKSDLDNVGYYDEVNIASDLWLKSYKTEPMDFMRPDGLVNRQKDALRDSSDADYWISLDRLIVKTKTNERPYDNQYHFAVRDVVVNSVWRVTDAKADTVCLLFQHNDSIFWKRWANDEVNALRSLPEFRSTLPEIADYVASRIYQIFGPYWDQIERFYYCSGSQRMILAVDCIRDDDWEGATGLWKDEYFKGFGKSVYRAAMNMMLYYETIDKPDEALEWASKAKDAMNKPFSKSTFTDWQVFNDYLTYLELRKEELIRLKAGIDD